MTQEHFTATTQYNDWKGSVAADDAYEDFTKFLSIAGILKQGDIVKGITFHFAENFFDVHAYITDDTQELRRESVKITLEQFFKTFKRFSIKISRDGDFDAQNIDFM
ncbi:hypothetical protein DT73_09725 [Mangrovibacter sp. MFB070]|uniref:hypothetical protein n=1 Tax=Mangrovibacter sp. MFB070 TaxID=1224318 RepID=UPI0004D90CFC|nr:hypothetical protein [Mangrovibacter sp. MFB070]KEA53005.1 hypothetical protein DT73_09725 [Mangrovibacter sp. MFB070]